MDSQMAQDARPEVRARRRALFAAGRATLDRRLQSARVQHRRRTTTRPGTLLRHQILIYTDWNENAPGFLEVNTVAMCGEVLDYRGRGEFEERLVQARPHADAPTYSDAEGAVHEVEGCRLPVADSSTAFNSRLCSAKACTRFAVKLLWTTSFSRRKVKIVKQDGRKNTPPIVC